MWKLFLAGIRRWLAAKWLSVLLAAVIAAVVAGLYLYVRGAERAKQQVVDLERRLGAAEGAAAANASEVENCLQMNRANAEEALLQRERARKAADRVRELERSADRRALEVDDEAEALRAVGLDCPAINGDYRKWMLDTPPEPIYVYKTVEVVRDRYIPLDSWLTQPVDVPELSEDFDVYELGAVAKAREIRLLQCNDQLSTIASIKATAPADP